MKIVFLEKESLGQGIDFEPFSTIGEVTYYDSTRKEQVEERIIDADILVVNKVPMNEETLGKAKNLKLICITATGTNIVDLDYTKQRGITVTNVKGYSTNTVAQHTFALYFQVAEKIAYYDQFIKNGNYSKSGMFVHLGPSFHELNGLNWGIVGLGDIGRKVASIAKAFGCNVQYYSTSGHNQNKEYMRVDWEELLRTSDIISIHAPLNNKTENLFNKDAFKKMKDSAYIINVGRGPIINERDLADAIDQEDIAGAGLDVFCKEPLQEDCPLLTIKKQDHLVMTPHIAWTSIEARTVLVNEIYNNMKAYLSGKERNVVH